MNELVEIRGRLSWLSLFFAFILFSIGTLLLFLMVYFQMYDLYGIVFSLIGLIFGPIVFFDAVADSKNRIFFTEDNLSVNGKLFSWALLLQAVEEEDFRYMSLLWKKILIRRVKKISIWFQEEEAPLTFSNTFLDKKDYTTLLEKISLHVPITYRKKESL